MDDTESLKLTTPGDREIRITRTFQAPRRLVFEAFAKPELLRRWMLGPPGWEMEVCEVFAMPGDSYRYTWRHADGRRMSLHGVCREYSPPERIVCTQVMDDSPGELLVTSLLSEREGKTTLTLILLCESREMRDAVIKSGMERGLAACYDRLAALLSAPA